MGIFDFLKSKQSEPGDARKAECPSCGGLLKKIPGAKTKCPRCGKEIFVRTTTKNERLVVTKQDADKIDEDWRIVNGTQEIFLQEQKKFQSKKAELTQRFGGKEPTEDDVRWGLYNEDLIEHTQNGDWGLYRNTRFNMAEQLRKEEKWKMALQTFLEVCYLDLNGPTNGNSSKDAGLLKDFPPFNLEIGGLYYTDVIKKIIPKTDLTTDQLKEIFLKDGHNLKEALSLPLSPEKAWLTIEQELF